MAVIDTRDTLPLILIIEDTVEIAGLLVAVVEEEFPVQTLAVTNGRAALDVLHGVRPALIILDYQLPGLSGIDIYDWLQARPPYATIPVLWMTANADDPAFRARSFSPVVRKPFALDAFIHAVQHLLAGPATPVPGRAHG